ncbi:hypothetical protein NRIC_28860 [Enterococcus florum]|uniref:HTH cro/C1-type domain-containing protein n=1 Tax=Enterococcus florum TaxID=2480627 RepID=A0A4P5PA57_9ENTE|nr:helix-turn-helix transcriptional regulator [Enterococcus florum]GCF94995.1 hypothetical protein NRIC_28860 [Enterococcus florum]
MSNFLGKQLRNYRTKHALTQKQLASMLYVSDKTVSKWERGNGQPDIDTLKNIARLLQMSVDDLLNKREPKTYYEYKSSLMIGMLPLIHIIIPNFRIVLRRRAQGKGIFTLIREIPHARGIISMGLFAAGGISLGLVSVGFLSLGVLSLGILAFGSVVAGIIAAGNLTIGTLALGNCCIGLVAMGNLPIGYLSLGNYAIGRIAIGNQSRGILTYSLGNEMHDQEIINTLQHLQQADISSFAKDWIIQPFLSLYDAPFATGTAIICLIGLLFVAIGCLLFGCLQLINQEKNYMF